MTTTQSLSGKRVSVAGRFGQLNGWNHESGLVTLWDEAMNEQVTFTLKEGDARPKLAMLVDRNGHEARRLFVDHKQKGVEGAVADLCAECVRGTEAGIRRSQPCDECGQPGAFRNAHHRRNEYLCPSCQTKTGEPIRQNKWAPRVSAPLGLRERDECMAKGGVTECRGEVRFRGPTKAFLCNAHAGRVSAADGLADREIEGLS